MCLDAPDDLRIYGNTESGLKRNLYISITKCASQLNDNCRPEKEAAEALVGAAVQVYYKQVKFDHTEFGQSSVKSNFNIEVF